MRRSGDHQFQVLDFPALGGNQGFQGLDVVRKEVGRASHGAMLLVFSSVEHQTARTGAVRSGRRQSMPSNSIASCAVVRETLPLVACGQTKRPCSSRLQNRHKPSPSHHSNLIRSPRRPRNTKIWPENGSASSWVCTRAARPSNPAACRWLQPRSRCESRWAGQSSQHLLQDQLQGLRVGHALNAQGDPTALHNQSARTRRQWHCLFR